MRLQKSVLAALAAAVLLAGCSSTPSSSVRVVDRAAQKPQRPQVTTGQYVVRRGDTLYSIAFRYGWDYKALAARNNIPPPYTIRLGQTLRFDGQNGTATVAAKAPSTVVTRSNSTSSSSTTTITRRPAAPSVAVAPGVSESSTASITTPTPVPAAAGETMAGGWTWPSNGVLIGKFASNGSLNKGIDIAGDLGQPVFAASDGSVVYAGSGLRGYGELIIIKHSDTYVSAYGHNRRLLVREGQQVKAGQAIAEMGSTGTDRVKLHFEIRRQGKPVDPMQFLPRR
ncbi:peptidoglycan DD-metalloendopeptidase family protein [Pseudomonas sp. hsmgli-8]|uniref:Peptidoglycan DD-metalloendopeptidase family protein n=2 Tax=Pseudomonas TaxID=286 RepID=A0ABX0YB74_9PSED|nr:MULTISPECIES: peptidoglycan DD-metalloendopeptidase family protein [Pseudomonas]MBF7141681.1 peptidoglycan DD-metalloendopeptidase family protein [Pseudomonas sp. LY10J]NJP00220.1 peptidoglycan DD-metalloendopeptidase family protein [Pseudomonas quercus]